MLTAHRFVLLSALAIACSSPAKTPLETRLHQGNFAFVMGWGNGMHGYRVLRIAADGEASYLYRRDDRWWRVVYRVSPESIARLQKKLDEVGYFSLKPRYAVGAIDGEQWFIKVRRGDRRHAVFLDNEFPPQVEELDHFVQREMIGQASGTRADPADATVEGESEPSNAEDVP